MDQGQQEGQVVKANALIESAGHRLTLAEQRVVLSAITQLRRDEVPSDDVLYSVDATEVAEVSGASVNDAYRDLADAAQRLYRRELRIEGGPNGTDQGPQGPVTLTRWVQTVRYVKGEGRIELRFARDVLPYLSALHEQFTRYQLNQVAGMRSAYGVRLYELLIQWRPKGTREIDLDNFRSLFGIEGRYNDVKDIRRRVIEPAVRDVNALSNIYVKWKQRKRGQRVVGFIFEFRFKGSSKRSSKKENKINKELEEEHQLRKHARPGESREQARARLKKKGVIKS